MSQRNNIGRTGILYWTLHRHLLVPSPVCVLPYLFNGPKSRENIKSIQYLARPFSKISNARYTQCVLHNFHSASEFTNCTFPDTVRYNSLAAKYIYSHQFITQFTLPRPLYGSSFKM